ncbi:MAG: TRAP transporter TatT component family protein [Desulfobacterales bacterium]
MPGRRDSPSRPIRYAFLFGFAILLLAVMLTACSTRKMTVRAVSDVMVDGVAAFEEDDDLELIEQALPANIKLLEALLESDPQNRQLLVLLARLYASYSFAFFDGRIEAAELTDMSVEIGGSSIAETKKTAVRYYRKGNEYALRALEIRHPEARRQLTDLSTAGSFISGLDREEMPALFWYGFTLSADINYNRDSISAVGQGHLVEKAMQRVIEADEAYFYGGAHLVLLVYYGSRSPLMGGKPELAIEHYRRLEQMNGKGFYLADLYYARFVLYQQQDRAKFTAVLNRILQDPATEERFRLYNKIAADRARIYLSAADRLFIE